MDHQGTTKRLQQEKYTIQRCIRQRTEETENKYKKYITNYYHNKLTHHMNV